MRLLRRSEPLGVRGERAAARHLRRRGYRVLTRNLHMGFAEADILCVAPDRRTLVVVEVKARRTHHDPRTQRTPEAAVGARKRRKLVAAAEAAARDRRWTDRPVRIDVVAVDFPPRGRPAIRHHEDAVRA